MSKVKQFAEHFNKAKQKGASRQELLKLVKGYYDFGVVAPVRMFYSKATYDGYALKKQHDIVEYDEKEKITARLRKGLKQYIVFSETAEKEIYIASYASFEGDEYKESEFSAEAFLSSVKLEMRELVKEFSRLAATPTKVLQKKMINEEIAELRNPSDAENARKEFCDVLYLLSQYGYEYKIKMRQCTVGKGFYFGLEYGSKPLPESYFEKKADLMRYFTAVHKSNMTKFIKDKQLASVLRQKEKNQELQETCVTGFWTLRNADGKVVKPVTYRKYHNFL